MATLTRNDVEALIEKHTNLCVSLFMPAHPGGVEAQQNNMIRFKNMVRQAGENLATKGLRTREVNEFLAPAHKLLEDGPFWRRQEGGVAVFLSSHEFRHFCLPYHFEELVAVNDRFHIKPLLPLLSGDGQFFLLALSQHNMRLLQGTRANIGEVRIPGVPGSREEAVRYDSPAKQVHFHARSKGRTGGQSVIFHGQGVGDEDLKEDLRTYCHQIDKGLHGRLKNEHAPLILAAVDYLHPIYREVNTYPYLVDQGLIGNPERLSPKELHEQAWEIIKPHFLEGRRLAIAQYKHFSGTGRSSMDVREIVPEAFRGRVEFLFIATGSQQWGTVDADKGEIRFCEEGGPGCQDLLDLAAVQTLVHKGTVYAVEPEEMPVPTPLAAVFRY
ncbi:MAG: hypothetical protein HYU64_18945 [Armatimonadetes bacterium]|nr:hypothetical protein [Armatimonadota bacterium]